MALHEVRKLANARRAIFENPKQIEISEKHLSDLMPDIIGLVGNIRTTVDNIYFKKFGLNKDSIDYNLSKQGLIKEPEFYPIGYCGEIRNKVFTNLTKIRIEKIIKLKKYGTIIKPIYGIYNKEYLHNAIQFGDYFLDVGNDTVNPYKEKIVYSRLNESLFENFESYADYCDVIQNYWKVEVYPNIYFNEIAFTYPFIIINDGKIEFIGQHTPLVFNDALKGFSGALDFVFNSKYSSKRLNEKQIKILETYRKKLFENGVNLNIKELVRKNIDYSGLNDNIVRNIIGNNEEKRKIINNLQINLNNPGN
ncbi:MAG: hypothetical protein PHG82_04560 [Candidatus Gracilibacteria bacterium]|nr:hypothetical protein [Candidatus Gracilibacteria bacterium]